MWGQGGEGGQGGQGHLGHGGQYGGPLTQPPPLLDPADPLSGFDPAAGAGAWMWGLGNY
jgi:hypothetical protein